MSGVSAALQAVTEKKDSTSDLDLSAMRSDLVSSATEAFLSGWSDAHSFLTLLSSGLTAGVDDTARDFAAAEKDQIDAITALIDTLDTE